MSIWDVLTDPAKLARGFWEWGGDGFERKSGLDEFESARRVAAGLRRRGVRPGDVVPAVITNGPDAMPGFSGIWFAGATVASLPIIARGMSIEQYVAQLGRLCDALGASFFLAEDRFITFLPPDSDIGAVPVGYRELIATPELAAVVPPDPDATIFIQFSSGTTGEPRGVELTGVAVQAQMEILIERLLIDPERDIGYVWLPLSHDMGFFGGNLLAWYTGIDGIRSMPERFLQSPRTWFDDCAHFGATVTAGPPSALQVAARAEQIESSGSPLNLRLCLVGAEHVEFSVLTKSAEAFQARGLELEQFTIAYGLAEATLAVTVGDLAEPPRFVDVDGDELAEGRIRCVDAAAPAARRLVSAGTPLTGTTVEIDPVTGEILVGSPSLAAGYYEQPVLTADRFHAGRVRTGDIGFVEAGELYIAGRSDDVVIVGGRNVYLHDLESEMGDERGVRSGNCAIVDRMEGGRARIGVVAELGRDAVDGDEVARRLKHLAMERAGLAVDEVVFVDRGTFPKTPSGKVQRFRCRELFAQGRRDLQR